MTQERLGLRLQAGGTLIPSRHVYIERLEDRDLLDALLQGEYCNVLTSRQMGKSSLVARTALKLAQSGIASVNIDVAGELGSPADAESWYKALLEKISRDLRLTLDFAIWWDCHRSETNNQRLLRFIREEVAQKLESPVVIFLDEIEATLKLPYALDDLFTAIRSFFNSRPFDRSYEKITFCLLGVATPNELIKDPKTTPYNIGRLFSLRDFHEDEDDLSPLIDALSFGPIAGRKVLGRILEWTGGHPYLTVLLCQAILQSKGSTPNEVDSYVEKSFASLERLGTHSHFQEIHRFLTQRTTDSTATLDLYEKILHSGGELDAPEVPHTELKLSGLVARDPRGRLVVRNRLYRRLFNEHWLRSIKPRPPVRWAPLAASISLLAVLATVAVVSLNRATPLGSTISLLDPVDPSSLDRGSTSSSAKGVIERTIRLGEDHFYDLDMEAGQYVNVQIDQRGADVVATLLDPGGRRILTVDSPTGREGSERLIFISHTKGRYRLDLKTLTPDGKYVLRVVEQRPATPFDRKSALAQYLLQQGRELRRQGGEAAQEAAVAQIIQALAIFQELGDFAGQSEAIAELGSLYRSLGRAREAAEVYRRALPLSKEEALTRYGLAGALAELGEFPEALSNYERAMVLWNQLGNYRQSARSLQAIARIYVIQGDLRAALSAYDRASTMLEGTPDARKEMADIFLSKGLISLQLGSLDAARQDLRRALDMYREGRDAQGEATALSYLGALFIREGLALHALQMLAQARASYMALGDRNGQTAALLQSGNALALLGRFSEAFVSQQEALQEFRASGYRRGEAAALTSMGRTLALMGRFEEARETYRSAIELWHSFDDDLEEAQALLGLARTEKSSGRLGESLRLMRRALELSKRDARSLGPHETILIRQPVSDIRAEILDAFIDGLITSKRPEEALLVWEQERAAAWQLAAAGRGRPYPGPRTFQEIQSLLDTETLLLEFKLGKERSFLWVVGNHSFQVIVLPFARQEAEDMTRSALLSLQRPGGKVGFEQQRRLRDLNDRLLRPAAHLIEGHRLVIAGDGLLESFPFGALVDRHTGEPLILHHEIVQLPSAAALAWLRESFSGRPSPPGLLAIVADPVYGTEDPRVSLRREDMKGGDEGGLPQLRRLPYAIQEAEKIAALVNPGESILFFGFSASRQAVLEGDLSRYRYLHFATHGLLETRHPELSGLILSTIDESGRPQDGFLSSSEIRKLDIPAELVVLSSCRTGVVRANDTEPLSLGRAFMVAGAKRVLVSLWAVSDQATSELMTHFYQGLLRNRLSPEAALREAQIAMLRSERWSHPYYWAGFILEGEWR